MCFTDKSLDGCMEGGLSVQLDSDVETLYDGIAALSYAISFNNKQFLLHFHFYSIIFN